MAKQPSASAAARSTYFDRKFDRVRKTAAVFKRHDRRNDDLRNHALQEIYEFGEEIRHEPEVLEAFVVRNGLPWNKVTRENPYNALVRIAFDNDVKDAWISQCSNTLKYAHETRPNTPLADWLAVPGGITARHKEATEHFGRTYHAQKTLARSERLKIATRQLISNPISPPVASAPDMGVPGFYQALVHHDGTEMRIVWVGDEAAGPEVEAKLLNLAPEDVAARHALAYKKLFRLYRAIDLICGCCPPFGKREDVRYLLFREGSDGEHKTTVIELASDAYTFTNARVTLADRLPGLAGQGCLALPFKAAMEFRKSFAQDGEWSICATSLPGGGACLEQDAKSPRTFGLLPLTEIKLKKPLRVGSLLGRRSMHFNLTFERMRAFLTYHRRAQSWVRGQNRQRLRDKPASKRLRASWLGELLMMQLVGTANIQTELLSVQKPRALNVHREFPVLDVVQLCRTLPAYGDDVEGWFADSDVEDAALCISHSFGEDLFELTMPLVIGAEMDRTLVCKEIGSEYYEVPPPTSGPGSDETRASSRSLKPKKGRAISVCFPSQPYPCKGHFGAYISCYLPDDAEHKQARLFDFKQQLEWWRRMTDIPVSVVASNWTDDDVRACNELSRVIERGGTIVRQPGQTLIRNRQRCLQMLYASSRDWGIVMDDDAVLMDSPRHNSGAAFFAEMAENGIDCYRNVDVFFPIFDGKRNSHGPTWNKDRLLYETNHVFRANGDLKGSLFVVRNFPKFNRPPVMAPPTFEFHGEDTLFAIEAIANGCTVMRCENMVLREFGGRSHFGDDRVEAMKIGNEAIARLYAGAGLRMNSIKGRRHLLDRSDMLKASGREHLKKIVVPKPNPPIARPW